MVVIVPPVRPSLVAIEVTVPLPVPAPMSERSCAGVRVTSSLVVEAGSAVKMGICVAVDAVEEARKWIVPVAVTSVKTVPALFCHCCKSAVWLEAPRTMTPVTAAPEH